MSIFKSWQRDSRSLRQFIRGLLFLRCQSHITVPTNNAQKHTCSLRSFHSEQHHDLTTNLRWGYGDNWVDGY